MLKKQQTSRYIYFRHPEKVQIQQGTNLYIGGSSRAFSPCWSSSVIRDHSINFPGHKCLNQKQHQETGLKKCKALWYSQNKPMIAEKTRVISENYACLYFQYVSKFHSKSAIF
jgi:hypothetical protein